MAKQNKVERSLYAGFTSQRRREMKWRTVFDGWEADGSLAIIASGRPKYAAHPIWKTTVGVSV